MYSDENIIKTLNWYIDDQNQFEYDIVIQLRRPILGNIDKYIPNYSIWYNIMKLTDASKDGFIKQFYVLWMYYYDQWNVLRQKELK